MISLLLCRDCKYYEPNLYKHFSCDLLIRWVEPDDFCAWGERKEKECNDLEHDSNKKILADLEELIYKWHNYDGYCTH